jgi:hypothetical protein
MVFFNYNLNKQMGKNRGPERFLVQTAKGRSATGQKAATQEDV